MDKNENNKNKGKHWGLCGGCCGSGFGFGVCLIVLGGFFLARDMGWISNDFSFWPVAILALGVYLVVSKSLRKSC